MCALDADHPEIGDSMTKEQFLAATHVAFAVGRFGRSGAEDQLAALGRPEGRGMLWPGTLPGSTVLERTPDDAPGWCAGSAGHVHLWLLAHEVTGEARHLTLAERAAWAAWGAGVLGRP